MVRRRKFSDEYKREAVRLATQPGVTKSQVAQELGINANLLGRWLGERVE
jgi:transposase